jgi:hypothetical protein
VTRTDSIEIAVTQVVKTLRVIYGIRMLVTDFTTAKHWFGSWTRHLRNGCLLEMLHHVAWQKLTDVLTAYIIRVMMEAVSTSEISVSFCQATWCNIPDDSNLHILTYSRLTKVSRQTRTRKWWFGEGSIQWLNSQIFSVLRSRNGKDLW